MIEVIIFVVSGILGTSGNAVVDNLSDCSWQKFQSSETGNLFHLSLPNSTAAKTHNILDMVIWSPKEATVTIPFVYQDDCINDTNRVNSKLDKLNLKAECFIYIRVRQALSSGQSSVSVLGCEIDDMEQFSHKITYMDLNAKEEFLLLECFPYQVETDAGSQNDQHCKILKVPNPVEKIALGFPKEDSPKPKDYPILTLVIGVILSLSLVFNIVFLLTMCFKNNKQTENKESPMGLVKLSPEREQDTGCFREYSDPCQSVGLEGPARPNSDHISENSSYGAIASKK